MTEREYQRMLDVVDDAINTDPAMLYPSAFDDRPSAANDNHIAWDLIAFPDGWTASP